MREQFKPFVPTSPFLQRLGTFYSRDDGGADFVLGFEVEPHHLNHHGVAHGGLISSLADNALGILAARTAGAGVVTVHLAIDFLRPAPVGAWLELRPVVDRAGGRTLFLSCAAVAGDAAIFKASAIFSVVRK